MWVVSDYGLIHSGRIVAFKQPKTGMEKTITAVLENNIEARMLRADAMAIIGKSKDELQPVMYELAAALKHDDKAPEKSTP